MSSHALASLAAGLMMIGAAQPLAAQVWPPPYPYYGVDSSLRFDVAPKDAEVYVDGYYAGIVDDYDGTFQRLRVAPGPHEVTVYREGYRSHSQKVYLSPNGTFKIKQQLNQLAPGEATEPRPIPIEPPPGVGPDPSANPPGQAPGTRRRPAPEREAPPPQTSAENRGQGTLSLRVRPADADVFIDGDTWRGGTTDPVVIDLAEGRHTLQIRKAGFVGYVTDVQIRRGETTTLEVNLRQP